MGRDLLATPIVALFAAFAIASVSMAQALSPKRLFAPASDVESGVVVLPDAQASATASQCALLFAPRAKSVRFEFESGGGAVRFTPLAPDALEWELAVATPADRAAAQLSTDSAHPGIKAVPDAREAPVATQAIDRGRRESLVSAAIERVATQSAFGCDAPTRSVEMDPASTLPSSRRTRGGSTGGSWIVEAVLPRGVEREVSREIALLVDDASDVALSAWTRGVVVRAGAPLAISIAASRPLRVEAPSAATSLAARCALGTPLGFEVREASVRWSSGRVERLEPASRARRADTREIAFGPAEPGDACVRIVADVFDESGLCWTRSVQMLVRATDPAWQVDGFPTIEVSEDARWVDLVIPIARPVAGGANALFAACELWAECRGGARLLGWIGGVGEFEPHDADRTWVRIGCEPDRVALAAGETLVCRNIRLHARDGFAPLDLVARAEALGSEALRGRAFSAPVAAEFGIPGIATLAAPDAHSFAPGAGAHVLALSPGYCSSGNSWPPSQFAQDAWFFEHPYQNQSHDRFAVALATSASAYKSYGIVGHSQGGCVALHLYTFYWSGLDWAGPGKLLQAIGSPLKGTPLAGNLAALAEVFGVQCGENYSMTTAGAAAWLSAIPTAARQRLHTYTTTFIDNWWSYDYCHLVTDPFLSDPEDGTTEHSAGHIPGAVNMGLKEGWCHVEDMSHPDQTLDPQRNASMNAETAR